MRARFATTMLLLGLLAAAKAMADAPPPPPRPPVPCHETYQPVCGTKDGKRVTYTNACFAGNAEATDVRDGKCEADKSDPGK